MFLIESRIAKPLTDKTIVYESHKDENGQDVDLEIKFGVEDLRRVLELGDSDDDPTIIPERLCKGLGCRMGFTGHIN
ncbi:hypothetical protein Hanom_Chr06g00516391 [Helianthus anomalus]